MFRVCIIISCIMISASSTFADDSEIIAALRGEGLMVDSAADSIMPDNKSLRNNATIDQTGISNKAISYQHGIDNAYTISQFGQTNTSLIVQVGIGNQAVVTQQGAGSYSAVTQIGTTNHVDVIQSINGSYLAIKQIGSGGNATVR